MKILELCSGSKVLSQYFIDRGHECITVDLDKKNKPQIIADVRQLPIIPSYFDLIWASPPCTEFSYANPNRTTSPDLTVFWACWNIILEFKPKFYVIENVKGADEYFGKPDQIIMPFYLWTNIPALVKRGRPIVKGLHRSARLRAIYPAWFIKNVFDVVTEQGLLFQDNEYIGLMKSTPVERKLETVY